MKRFLVILMVVAMASFLFVGCIPIIPPVDPPDEPGLYFIGIEVDPEKMDLNLGLTKTGEIGSVTANYELRVHGADVALEDCLFLTSDSKVATVKKIEGEGVDPATVTVTAVGVGIADILVEYEGKFATLEVTVTYTPMEMKVDMPLFEATIPDTRFGVEVVANDDEDKWVKFYFTFPKGFVEVEYEAGAVVLPTGGNYTVEIYEDVARGWVDLSTLIVDGEVVLGTGTAFDSLTDEFRFFKATFSEEGSYEITVEVWEIDEDEEKDVLLCTKVITAIVSPALPPLG
ncbi:hypothetical protein ES708_34585 [subsurface metagenome]